jgi:predicted ATP-binding protein involved in virulence
MLNKLEIKLLFGLYSYKLEFTNGKDSNIKFITGPNGYGKTTILSLIFNLFERDFSKLANIPFSTLNFCFDDKNIYIERSEITENTDNSSDLKKENSDVTLNIKLRDNQRNEIIDELVINSSLNNNVKLGNNIEMFLSVEHCYRIFDQRLFSSKREENKPELNSSVVNQFKAKTNAEDFKIKLEQLADKLKDSLLVSNLKFEKTISSEEYETRQKTIIDFYSLLKEYGLYDDLNMPPYSIENSTYLNAYLTALEDGIDKCKEIVGYIGIFNHIINKSAFANKKLEISPRYGFRFIADNELRTILTPDMLSSGEQHILIQAYELLFNAPKGSLVLIDEPELSFHLMWQIDFFDNLCTIAEAKNLQCIVATHSTEIFGNDWNKTIDLFELSSTK